MSKCGSCGFADHCWPRAIEQQDVSLVMDVDQGLARQFTAMASHCRRTPCRLRCEPAERIKPPMGSQAAEGRQEGREDSPECRSTGEWQRTDSAPAGIPAHENYVCFDLEGIPPQLDDLEKIYLWGMQVYGKKPGEFLGVTSGFGADGDREGWEKFLTDCGRNLRGVRRHPIRALAPLRADSHSDVHRPLRRYEWNCCPCTRQSVRPPAHHEELNCSSAAELQPQSS